MKSDDPGFTGPAMDVVRRTDPVTYGKMVNTVPSWEVRVVTPETQDSLRLYAEYTGDVYLEALNAAFGATIYEPDDITPVPLTFINRYSVEAGAKRMHVPVADFLADVLVHEFAHEQGANTETPAFRASTEFARKLPASDAPIVKLSNDTLRKILERGDS